EAQRFRRRMNDGIGDRMKTDFNREKRERRERSVFPKLFRACPCFAVLESSASMLGWTNVKPKVPQAYQVSGIR
ncbi:MAG: hypothetical protein LBM17_05580, partial [Candidatus Accumulibacter sp.]|nr:hypothetical protein [Accumulibacter sp.]